MYPAPISIFKLRLKCEENKSLVFYQADIQNLKDAVGSAVDVMQAMASSICYLSSKVTALPKLLTV